MEDNKKQYSEEQIQFLQKLVKEQRDLEQQIKILKKASRERENRKKQIDATIIKYFKTNDISHVNLQSSNCRLECVTVKSRTGMSQKFVTNMLQDLLTDEELSRDVLDYILSGRQTSQKFKLKAVDNYKQKRRRTKPEPKPDKKYTTEEKAKLMNKLKDRFNGKLQTKQDINININENIVDPANLTQEILIKGKEITSEDSENMEIVEQPIEQPIEQPVEQPVVKPKQSKYKIKKNKKEKPIIEENIQKTSNTQTIKKQKNDIETIIADSNINDIIKVSNQIKCVNSKKQDINNTNGSDIASEIDSFIKNQMSGLKATQQKIQEQPEINNMQLNNSVTDLQALYQGLMNKAQTSIGLLPPQMTK